MKPSSSGALAAAAILTLTLSSCEALFPERKGELRLHFAGGEYTASKATDAALPDTSSFLLTITDELGATLYDGSFGASPGTLLVDPGTYDIRVRSAHFDKPRFSAPLFGDDQCVVVPAGKVTDVRLRCRQVNAGIRLNIAPDFLTACPDGVLYVASDAGKMLYTYREKRIAYFLPGAVSILLNRSGVEKPVFTRNLAEQEVLTVAVSAVAASDNGTGGHLSIAVDTTRNWTSDAVVIGRDGASGAEAEGALDIGRAREHIGAQDVWVYGYIVGAFKTGGSLVCEAPFPSATNLAIAARPSVSAKEDCLSVELKKGSLRDELNLAEHPAYKGRKVFLKGDIVELYFGVPGIKSISEWQLE